VLGGECDEYSASVQPQKSTFISHIAANMADITFSISAEITPRPERSHGRQGWHAALRMQADMNAIWQQRDEAKKSLCGNSNSGILVHNVEMT